MDKSERIQDDIDKLNFDLLGSGKRAAIVMVNEDIKSKASNTTSLGHNPLKITEIYQNEQYDVLRRVWVPIDMVSALNPTVALIPPPFDPVSEIAATDPVWCVDFNVKGTDGEGFTYASSITALNNGQLGESEPSLHCFYRRRVWFARDRYKSARGYDSLESIA